jgi:hypothetical protein
MRRYIERNVEDKLANLVIDNYGKQILGIHLSVENDDIKLKSLI